MKNADRLIDLGGALGLAAAVLIVYQPALRAGFIWDDDGHITKPALQSLHGLWRIWFEIGATQQYYPVLHSAFWLEHRLWGQSPFGYHLLNIGLHILASLLFARLVFVLLAPQWPAPLRRSVAYLAAGLFALHPVCVETVAWVSEQKNTLSAVFYLCAALAYLRFDADRNWRWYGASFGLFVLALLSKSVTATLPAALLVILWFRRGRLELRRDWAPLALWFPLAGAMGWLTGYVERTQIGAEGTAFALSFVQRCVLAGRIFWFYLEKLAWPAGLSFNYVRWTIDARRPVHFVALFGAFALVAAIWAFRKRARAPLAAVLCFGGTLFPALGFFNVYPFVYSYVADHFQYLASLAYCALAATGVGLLGIRSRLTRWIAALASVLVLGWFGFLSHSQARIYRDAETLYRATLERNPASALAWTNLGLILYDRGDLATAIEYYKRALASNPHMVEARNDLGIALADAGRWDAAIEQFAAALRDKNPFPQAQINLSRPLIALGRYSEADAVLRSALLYLPNEPAAHLALGRSLHGQGQYAAAIQEYQIVLKLRPDLPGVWNFLGDTLVHLGRTDEAMPDFIEALRLRPAYADARFNYALALVTKGQIHEAVTQLIEANRLDPDRPEIYREIASLMERAGHPDQIERFNRLADAAAARLAARASAPPP